MTASLDSRRVLIPRTGRPPAHGAGEHPIATAAATNVRRYRLGRMPLYTRPDPETDRFAQLRRSYD